MSTSSGIRLSFVIPVRNSAGHLARCLTSIARATREVSGCEVVVGDNGSRDETPAVARQMGARVVELPGLNVAAVRNRATTESVGALLAFVDADHEIDPGWPAAALSLLDDPDVVAAGAQYDPPPDANWVQRAYDTFRRRSRASEEVDWLPSGNLVVRRAAFEAAGGFDTTLETCEDVDLCRRLRAAGGRIVSDPRLRSVHRGDPSTLRAVFMGELWRGRDNLRVTARGPMTLRDVPSVAIPVLDLAALAAVAIGLLLIPWGGLALALAGLTTIVALAGLRAVSMLRRRTGPSNLDAWWQTLLVAGTYDVARALAVVGRVGHEARRRG